MTDLTVFIFNFLGHPEGRAYVLRMMYLLFFFFSPCILRAPSTDCPETLPHDRNLAVFYNPTPKIRGGGTPPKKFGAKNTSNFDREYLWNKATYPKSERRTN